VNILDTYLPTADMSVEPHKCSKDRRHCHVTIIEANGGLPCKICVTQLVHFAVHSFQSLHAPLLPPRQPQATVGIARKTLS
jgi:hypothetical protein